jgi:signal transduction histidine kinase
MAGAAMAALLVAGAFTRTRHDAVLSVIGIAVAIPATVLAAAARRPAQMIAFSLLAGAGVVLDSGHDGSCVGWFGLCLLAFICMYGASGVYGMSYLAAAFGVFVWRLVDSGFNPGWLPWMGGLLATAGAGAALAHERRLLEQLRAAQADLAERSRVEERARIARDLHDVIAHSLTVSLLHISGARLALQDDPGEAARSLEEAERLGRESLDEVRSIVGLMRAGDEPGRDRLAPQPTVEGIADLVERFRAAGAPITLELGAGARESPATVGTTAYRIAQEALTNAAKHAPGKPVRVSVTSLANRLQLVVDSDGRPRDGSGHGLETMSERAQAVGGTLEAGPASDGRGWRVTALLPMGRGLGEVR